LSSKLIHIVFVIFFVVIGKICDGQNVDENSYNHYTDTLIIIGDLVVDKYKVHINREDFLETDTLKVNQKGFKVISFKINALALGANITLSSESGAITTEMKNEILNERIKYKFIYLKDILLQSSDGRMKSPSTKSIKVIFRN